MLSLWVFGRDVEDDFGHIRFLAFYLITGILAALAFAYAFPETAIPLVGASGAIAGTLGAYFLRFPTARVRCLLIIIIIVRMINIPAFILLGIWFFIQIGASMTSISRSGAAGAAGVAWISHVAGFVVGIIWTLILLRQRYHERRGGI
jgi:membrane associated rhomboid family serine protease